MVLHQELVQSNEVSSSNAMELEGLKRGLQFFAGQNLQVNSLVTDRHRSISKYMREDQSEIDHRYDVWHIAKGTCKKIDKLAKKKTCAAAGAWAKSVSNHLYWVAASTPDGDGDVMLAKWLSVANHIQDVHQHDSDLFPRCVHGELNVPGRKKKWLQPSTEVCEKMVQVITAKCLQKDVMQLSSAYQTSNVESFHSVVIHFAPKNTHYSYHGMISRLQLAALHFNENSSRSQATTNEGKERFAMRFPKFKKGQATVSKVLTDATYGYVEKLTSTLLQLCKAGRSTIEDLEEASAPPPLASSYVHPDKEEAVQQHKSRYN
ncbi:hypothetical protein BSL78_27407 [Apostichopus japonicus]|uniref:Uncharacterized protein n=1 Tax=Stichopus japonicus TaxID=307972 RepID=A0A2G8JJ46_STIJA|nr:hypothetical protein BSL78_27407 [Apostichopus japonicus]